MTPDPLRVRAVIEASGPQAVTVALPLRQPGTTAYLGRLACGLVVKFLAVDDLRRALRTRSGSAPGGGLREPRWAAPLRRAPWPDNPFRPDRARADRLRRGHDRAVAVLGTVTRETAEAAVRHTVPGLPGGLRRMVVSAAFGDGPVLGLVPEPSRPTVASFPDLGVADVPALLQQDAGPRAVRLAPAEPDPATAAAVAVLLCLAQLMADRDGIGLDLVPRADRRGLYLPNVLVRREGGGPAYVDFFGLGDPDGCLVERCGHRALYRGPRLLAALAANATRAAAPSAASARGAARPEGRR
ncbi:hypothetical protein [Streptacidiphilus jiangxiensis]|uniref:Uncharacterized protein n=1 Tax=Streptacidiphilus jiangxiensis TaxID=235985 RepID=A0A1H7WJF8_STRJI|nr:hypothetical protein [Streptacidiphilus jiangxiensis]SEM21169.1 hypothetical protein SAMN05414137_120178 [Streptacidiphilus jiangxiensis]